MQNFLTAIIITKNESLHIARCIDSVSPHVDKIVVIDSGSSDDTKNITVNKGAEFYLNDWKGYSNQVNWAIKKVSKSTEWILRIDADEIINESPFKIKDYLKNLNKDVHGLNIIRNIYFNRVLIKSGGIYKKKILRIFKSGFGECDDKMMDEHIKCIGNIKDSPFYFSDISLISFKDYINKHINYAYLEVASRLEEEKKENQNNFQYSKNTRLRKFLKEKIYYNLPSRYRPWLFFFYRIFIRGGIFDSKDAFYFHLFQGLMYRSFVEYLYHQKIED